METSPGLNTKDMHINPMVKPKTRNDLPIICTDIDLSFPNYIVSGWGFAGLHGERACPFLQVIFPQVHTGK